MGTGSDKAHWVEVIDELGLFPVKRLGPYDSERLASRARRGVMRLLNAGRYRAAVVSPQQLEDHGRPEESQRACAQRVGKSKTPSPQG